MLKIGEFSKLSRISIRMLRHYDEIGLLRPALIDPDTLYRYYAPSQLQTASRILALRDMGFGLAAIREMLHCYDDRARMADYFGSRAAELRALAEETAYRLRLLDTAQQWLRKDELQMNYNVTVKTIPERTVAAVRMVLPSYDAEGIAWGILMEETAQMNLIPDEPCLCSVVFHDDEYKEANVDVEIQKSVRGTYPDTARVKFRREPAVTVASAIHNGSYLGLDAAMRAVAQWVQDNGYAFGGAAFCIYHISPHETQNPEEFVTEICYPIQNA